MGLFHCGTHQVASAGRHPTRCSFAHLCFGEPSYCSNVVGRRKLTYSVSFGVCKIPPDLILNQKYLAFILGFCVHHKFSELRRLICNFESSHHFPEIIFHIHEIDFIVFFKLLTYICIL